MLKSWGKIVVAPIMVLRWSVAALLCLGAVVLVPLLLAEIAWPTRGVATNICWLLGRLDTNQFSAWKVLSNLLLAPILESIPLLLIYMIPFGNKLKYTPVFIYGFIIHGVSPFSIGKAIAFLIIYITAKKRAGELGNAAVFLAMAIIHLIWNVMGSLLTLVGVLSGCTLPLVSH